MKLCEVISFDIFYRIIVYGGIFLRRGRGSVVNGN